MRKITVGEFLDALDKNGYPWTQGTFLTNLGASCAMGQAFRNLGYEPYNIIDELNPEIMKFNSLLMDVYGYNEDESLNYTIIGFNDVMSQSYDDVVKFAHGRLDEYRNEVIPFDDSVLGDIAAS